MLVANTRNFINSGLVVTLGSRRALCNLSVVIPRGRKIVGAFL